MNISLYPLKISNLYTRKEPSKREWCAEKLLNKKRLLICIGESWTWGLSLGNTDLEYNDKKSRYNQFYINKLAEKLDSDWLMIAWNGESNTWILDQYEIVNTAVMNNFYKQYEKVYVHVCLTELFREIENEKILNTLTSKIVTIKNLDDLIKFYFNFTIAERIKKIKIPSTHLFSKNFWNFNSKLNNFVKDTWQDVLFDKAKIQAKNLPPVISGVGIYPLLNFLKKNKLKSMTYEFSKMLPSIISIIDQMNLCKFNKKEGTKHPTAEGHQIWADYLYDYYKDL